MELTDDFNGDGTSDILFRRSKGTPMLFDIDHSQIQAGHVFAQFGPEWSLSTCD